MQVHPGTGVVDRRRDTLLVVPALPTSHERVRELLDLCRHPEPAGEARISALRALLQLRPSAEVPGFALLLRSEQSLRVLVHGAMRVLVDGREARQPAAHGGEGLAETVVDDGTWQEVTVTAEREAGPPSVADVLSLDLETGAVPGSGVTLHRIPAGRAPRPPATMPTEAVASTAATTSTTTMRPTVQFRTVLLGEAAVRAGGPPPPARRSPLPVAGARGQSAAGSATSGPEVVVEGVHCPAGHFTDPDLPTCRTCGTPLPPDAQRVSLPRPPLGLLVTDGGTIYTVTGDFVIGREAEQAPEVLEGRARPLPLRDAARSTSRVHARLTVEGWKVLLSDNRSANGTFLSRSGAAGPWLPVTPHPPVALVHGDRVRVGQRQLLFDAWREAVLPQAYR